MRIATGVDKPSPGDFLGAGRGKVRVRNGGIATTAIYQAWVPVVVTQLQNHVAGRLGRVEALGVLKGCVMESISTSHSSWMNRSLSILG